MRIIFVYNSKRVRSTLNKILNRGGLIHITVHINRYIQVKFTVKVC